MLVVFEKPREVHFDLNICERSQNLRMGFFFQDRRSKTQFLNNARHVHNILGLLTQQLETLQLSRVLVVVALDLFLVDEMSHLGYFCIREDVGALLEQLK